MPSRQTSLRYSFDEIYDILVITSYELIPLEAREYPYRRMIMYVPFSPYLQKIKII